MIMKNILGKNPQYIGYAVILLLLIFNQPLSKMFSSVGSSFSSISLSTSSKHVCQWCGDSYGGRGFTSAMYVVNQVDSEDSPLNSYCSRKCTIEWIRSKGREPLKVN